MAVIVQVLTTDGHKCLLCSKVFKTDAGLKRHQAADDLCALRHEQTEARTEGFEMQYYLSQWVPRGKRWKYIDTPALARAKKLGVEWFESPRTFRAFYLPSWYLRLWNGWPEKTEVLLTKNPDWKTVKRRRGGSRYVRVYKSKFGEAATGGFDAVVSEALRDDKAMAKLKMRLIAGALHLYPTSSAPDALARGG